ncbi:hypothetical protein SAMN05421739_11620 [Pontibacter chinhatensis]|uniref:Uncharacterized protein n=1 Tax=Pontibacter chinhatensis TaxID=1436961 RepID=A0A1I2ZMW7_9BACT|nr:hypothetical protein SAMN05421739_11620 [Pontibacter chinhatensis]
MQVITRNVKNRATIIRYVHDALESGMRYWTFRLHPRGKSKLVFVSTDTITSIYLVNQQLETELASMVGNSYGKAPSILGTWLRKEKMTRLGF